MSIIDVAKEVLHKIYDVEGIMQWGGYSILFLIIFAETGLFFGFFLPGDSLLVTAGLVAQTTGLNILVMNLLFIIAAVSGDATGYYFGHKVGKKLFERKNSHLFKQEYLLRTQRFYEKYGGKTIVIARFIPIIRTFAPIVAGTANMSYKKFATYNILGGALWVISMTSLGYFLAATFPQITESLHILILIIIVISFIPAIIEIWRERKALKR